MRVRSRLGGLVLSLLLLPALASCSDDPDFLSDEAACPGDTCTEDTQARLDAIATVDGVGAVVSVARSYRFDRGASSSAVVESAVRTDDQARELALAVLEELVAWPDHDASVADVTVRSAPAVEVTGAARGEVVLEPAFYDPCSPSECAATVAELAERLDDEFDGVDVTAEVAGARLLVTGTAPREEAALVRRAAVRELGDLGIRVARRAEISIEWRAPLEVTLRMSDGLVCEQSPGVVIECDRDNALTVATNARTHWLIRPIDARIND